VKPLILSVRRIFEVIRVIFIFFILTFVLYSAFSYFSDVIKPSNPYRQPEGRAIKAMGQDKELYANSASDYWERLKFFYWFGEGEISR
jgi:hypothetical protein